LAVKTLEYHPAELVCDPICHIEPVPLSVKAIWPNAFAKSWGHYDETAFMDASCSRPKGLPRKPVTDL